MGTRWQPELTLQANICYWSGPNELFTFLSFCQTDSVSRQMQPTNVVAPHFQRGFFMKVFVPSSDEKFNVVKRVSSI